jgi:hypothetical protein
MRLHLAPLAASAAVVMLVAACSSSATPAPAATPAAAASVAASAAPSAAPSASPEASMAPEASTAPAASLAIPSFTLPNQDTNLEALLPNTFGGVKLQKFSMKGEQYLSQGSGTQLDAAMSGLGLTAADLSVAVAADPTGAGGVTFLAIRFAGADSGKLQQVFLAAAQSSGDYVGSVSVGGKDVIKSKDTAGTSFSYFYVKNDTVLGVTAKDDATADPALAVLP